METAIKHLRDGLVREELGSPLVVVHDGLDVVGGRDVLIQLCQGFQTAMCSQRAQATHLYVVAIEKDPSLYVLPSQQHASTIIDMHMHGWHTKDTEQQSSSSCAGHADDATVRVGTLEQLEAVLLQPRHTESSGQAGSAVHTTEASSSVQQPTCAVIIDSLSQLLLRYSSLKVLGFLSILLSHPKVSCVLALLHRDLHDDHLVAGIEYLSTCSIKLQPLADLQREVAARHLGGTEPHGCMSFRYKRRAGHVHAESFIYTLMSSGAISLTAPPAALAAAVTAESLVSLSLKQQQGREKALLSAPAAVAPTGPSGPGPSAKPEALAGTAERVVNTSSGPYTPAGPAVGGMRHELNEQERQAKEQVRLPYVHQGQGGQYQTGDFRDYLPAAAGGHAGAQHSMDFAAPEVSKLGHILYVRDSEEEHDSDEDPDDDLDI